MQSISWSTLEQKYFVADEKLHNFFNLLSEGKVVSPNINITYRDSQELFSILVMKAIRNKEVLLIEAGVGTGKSFGYLLPIFYTMGEVTTFNKVLISTSSIALQDQLIKDIGTVSNLLNIPIKAEISKGIVNYACLRNVEIAYDKAKRHRKKNDANLLSDIQKLMCNKKVYDRKDFDSSVNPFWERIKVNGGCQTCYLKEHCEFIKGQARINKANIVVTNHAQLANMIKNKNPIISESNFLVVDEAHKFDEELRLSTERQFDLMSIWTKLNIIRDILKNSEESFYFTYEIEMLNKMIPTSVKNNPYIEFIRALRSNGRSIFKSFNNSGLSLNEVEKLNINIESKGIREQLNNLLKFLKPFENLFEETFNIPGLKTEVDFIKESIKMLEDMYKGKNSEYIYWIRLLNSSDIELVYTKKDMSSHFDKLYGGKKKPIVFTSATLEINNNYKKIKRDLNLNGMCNVVEEEGIISPFDYDSNSLFYYDKSLTKPTDRNKAGYIADLAIKIKELIEITDGKALILFTAKSDMENVYKLVKTMMPDRHLILQKNKNVNKWKNEFERDINSCLFATGAFWEGIDLKGKTLSNLIIARLPFPVQDSIVEYKMNLEGAISKDVSLNEMLMKLKQGTGRLIRSVDDKGIICCLDSRVPSYLDDIIRTLPFTIFTDNIYDVINFSEKNITTSKGRTLILTKK